jgi:hypothetical protein
VHIGPREPDHASPTREATRGECSSQQFGHGLHVRRSRGVRVGLCGLCGRRRRTVDASRADNMQLAAVQPHLEQLHAARAEIHAHRPDG